jgi:hypothetical protein
MKPAVTRSALFVLMSLALAAPVRADHDDDSDSDRRKEFKAWSKQVKHDRRWDEREVRLRRQYYEKMRRLHEREARARRARWEKIMRAQHKRCDDRFPGRGIGRDSRSWLVPTDWNNGVRMGHVRRDCDFRSARNWPTDRRDRRDWPTSSRDRNRTIEDVIAERMGTRRRTDINRDRRDTHERWEQIERARRAEMLRRRAEIIRARRQAACDYRSDRQHDGRTWVTGLFNNDDRHRNDRLNDILRDRCADRDLPRVVRRDTRWPGQYPRNDLVGGNAAARTAAERALSILRTD